jgi:hypothetical protein
LVAPFEERRKNLMHRIEAIARLGIGVWQISPHQKILADRHLGEDHVALRNVDDSGVDDLLDRLAPERGAGEADFPRDQRQQPRNAVEQRRLAMAVRADDADDLAVLNLERHRAQHRAAIIAGGHLAHLEKWLGHRVYPAV